MIHLSSLPSQERWNIPSLHDQFEQIANSQRSYKERALLLEPFFSDPDFSEADKITLLSYTALTQQMDEHVVFKAAMEIPNIPESTLCDLAWTIKDEKNYRTFVKHCWDNNLATPLKELFQRPCPCTLFYDTLSPLLETEALEQKKEILIFVLSTPTPPYIKLTILSYLTKHEKETEALTQALVFNGGLINYVVNDDRFDSTETLEFLLRYCWNHPESTGNSIYKIAEKLKEKKSHFVQEYVHKELDAKGISLPFFTVSLAQILKFLAPETRDKITAFFDEKMNDSTLSTADKQRLNKFIMAGSINHLFIWKYRYENEARNLQLLAPGSQEGRDGPVLYQEILPVINALNENRPSSVQFNDAHATEYLNGGTCSAMTFAALREYRKQRIFVSPREAIENIKGNFTTSTKEFRTIQAAYNTIEKCGDSRDFKADKIEALLRYENPNLTISHVSDPLQLNTFNANEQLEFFYESFPEGTYIVRSLNIPDFTSTYLDDEPKRKEESYGHTTLLIRDLGESFYYDPSVGFLSLNHKTQLPLILQWQQARWNIPEVRFYKIGEVQT